MGLASFLEEQFSFTWTVYSGDTSGLQNASTTNFICLETEKAVECWGGPSSSSCQVQPWWQGFRQPLVLAALPALPMHHTRFPHFVGRVRYFDFPALLQAKEKGQVLLFCCSCRAALQRTVFATS